METIVPREGDCFAARRRLLFSHSARFTSEADFSHYLADVRAATNASDELIREATAAYRPATPLLLGGRLKPKEASLWLVSRTCRARSATRSSSACADAPREVLPRARARRGDVPRKALPRARAQSPAPNPPRRMYLARTYLRWRWCWSWLIARTCCARSAVSSSSACADVPREVLPRARAWCGDVPRKALPCTRARSPAPTLP